MYRVEAVAIFSALEIQLYLLRILILDQTCTPDGSLSNKFKVDKILNWPNLTTPKEARGFLRLYSTVRIWMPSYPELARLIIKL